MGGSDPLVPPSCEAPECDARLCVALFHLFVFCIMNLFCCRCFRSFLARNPRSGRDSFFYFLSVLSSLFSLVLFMFRFIFGSSLMKSYVSCCFSRLASGFFLFYDSIIWISGLTPLFSRNALMLIKKDICS